MQTKEETLLPAPSHTLTHAHSQQLFPLARRVTWILLSALLLTPVGNGPFCACPNRKMIWCWLAQNQSVQGPLCPSDLEGSALCELLCKAFGEARKRQMSNREGSLLGAELERIYPRSDVWEQVDDVIRMLLEYLPAYTLGLMTSFSSKSI